MTQAAHRLPTPPPALELSRLEAEAKKLAAERRGELEAPRTGAAELRRRLRSHRSAVENYLENRRRDASGREDLLPLYFIWTTLRTCNFRCTYCDDHQGKKYPDLDNSGVLDTAQGIRLLEIMRTRAPSVYFAGGEPTLRRDLPVLTRAARDLDYYPIIVNTNGSAIDRHLKQPSWRTWLADTDIVVVSLDGLDPAVLGPMWAYRRPEDVIRNVLLLRELAEEQRVKLMVNCVIQPGLVRHARAVLDFAMERDLWFCPVPMNQGPRAAEGLFADPEYQRLVERILAAKARGAKISGSLRMNERLLRGAKLECRNTLKPHVDYDGTLLWPCKASVNVRPVALSVLDFPDVDALYAEATRRVSPHKFHGPAQNQCGASCNWAQNYTTDAYAHGLRHPTALLADVLEFSERGGAREENLLQRGLRALEFSERSGARDGLLTQGLRGLEGLFTGRASAPRGES